MIEEQARVTAVHDNQVTLSISRQHGCHGCNLKQGCGVGSLGKLLGRRDPSLTVSNDLNLKSGDKVIVAIPDRSYLLASGLIYMLPLLLMFLAGGVADSIWRIEWLTALLSIAGLASGLLISSSLSQHRYSEALRPKIIRQIW